MLIYCCYNNAYASYCSLSDLSLPNNLNKCSITRSTRTDCAPSFFPTSNNLIKPDSGCSYTKGSKIIIKGRVLDHNCIPVSDAKVYLWQRDYNGRYSYKYKKNHLDTSESFFKGAGSTKTNTRGDFYFITMKPMCGESRVNIKVEHPRLHSLHTKLAIKPENIVYNDIKRSGCADNTLCKRPAYGFTIVMRGATLKRY